MKKSQLALVSIVFFSIGIFAAKPLNSFSQIFKSERPRDCVTKEICVGANKNVLFGLYELDTIGGLASIFCGKPYDKGNIDYIFLNDLLKGIKCERPQYSLDFRTDMTRTKITIENDIIIKITQGPIHTLDP